MDIHKIWESALAQLQMEMPRASFDTWARDTYPIEYNDNIITVGVRNQYARDWLENRLVTTVDRILADLSGLGEIHVSFVVAAETEAGASGEEGDRQEGGGDLQTAETKRGALFDLLAQYTSLYDQIVKPHAVVPLDAYFIRYLHWTGPEIGCIYFAGRQLAFFESSQKTGKVSARFYLDSLVRWCGGMSRSTVANYLGNPKTWEKLSRLMWRESVGKEWSAENGIMRQLPVRYTVEMSLPLTPADAESLTIWIGKKMNEGLPAEAILNDMIKTAETKDGNIKVGLEELIPLNNNYNSESDYSPMFVLEILQQVFGGMVDDAALITYAARLEKLIMPTSNVLMISHFFALHVWPHLKPGPGWVYLICRDKTYKGEREELVVKGGFREIAQWIGLSGENGGRTVRGWFNETFTESRIKSIRKRSADASKKKKKEGVLKERRGGGREKLAQIGKLRHAVLHVYLAITTEKRYFGSSSLTLRVLQNDLPFEILYAGATGEKEGIEKLAKRIIDFDPSTYHPEPGQYEPHILDVQSGALWTLSKTHFGLSDERTLDSQIDALWTLGLAHFGFTDGALCTHSLAHFVLKLGAFWTVKSSTSSLSNSKPNSDQALTNYLQSQPETAEEVGSKLGAPDVWMMRTLLRNGRTKKDDHKKYNNSHVWRYLSRLLYAISPQGMGIKHPPTWSLSHLDDPVYDLPQYMVLAKLSPRVLVRLAYQAARRTGGNLMDDSAQYRAMWFEAMGNDPLVGEKVLECLLGRSPVARSVTIEKEIVDAEGNVTREIKIQRGER